MYYTVLSKASIGSLQTTNGGLQRFKNERILQLKGGCCIHGRPLREIIRRAPKGIYPQGALGFKTAYGGRVNKWSVPRRFSFSLLLSSFFLILTVYNIDSIKRLPLVLQGIAILFASFLQLKSGYFVEYLAEQNKHRLLSAKHKRLKERSNQRDRDLAELRDLIVSFLDHSEIYREKVKTHLGLGEDYLCIAKSAEGLSDVFEAIGGGIQLPFTQVLHNLPGSVKPLETMDMFFIPMRNLPKLRGRSLTDFIDQEIIPLVRRRRSTFLNSLPVEAATLADEFSYKYVAFLVNRFNIAHSVRNRKFNEAFAIFFVNEHIANDFKDLKSELVEVVNGKDIFELVNWSAFADLNSKQLELVFYYRNEINNALSDNGIDKLSDLAVMDYESLQGIIWPVVRRKSTKRKVANICHQTIDGAANAVDILRRNGVTL